MTFILIGQKNVGKSSIFNRLLKKNNIVHSKEGSTRDFIPGSLIKDNKIIELIDTPGINPISKNKYDKEILFNLEKKIHKKNIVLLILDYKKNINEIDKEIIRWVRKLNLEIILIINKFDSDTYKNKDDFLNYGFDNLFYTSCVHNKNIQDLRKFLFLKSTKEINIEDKTLKEDYSIVVLGKPNVGKSTFINTFLGYKRYQEGDKPGITTDSIDEFINYKNILLKIFDTAGIRSKNKIDNKLETTASLLTIKKISSKHISILIIDSQNEIDRQDKRLINLISKKGGYLLIIFNKFDLIKNKKEIRSKLLDQVKHEIFQVKNIKCFFISSLQFKQVEKIFLYILENIKVTQVKISTSNINKWLSSAVKNNSHPLIKNKKVNFKYAIQIKKSPIVIKIFTNYSSSIRESYKRYLINSFNKNFKIQNQKINIFFSSSKNPYLKNL